MIPIGSWPFFVALAARFTVATSSFTLPFDVRTAAIWIQPLALVELTVQATREPPTVRRNRGLSFDQEPLTFNAAVGAGVGVDGSNE